MNETNEELRKKYYKMWREFFKNIRKIREEMEKHERR